MLTIPPNSFSGSGTPQVLRNKIPNYTDKSGKIVINSTKSQDLPSIKSPVPSSVYTLPSAIASINNESFSNIPPAISTSEITELKQDTVGITNLNQDSVLKNNDNLVSRLRSATKNTL
ncbi:MAG: hypothetical protein ACKO86_01425, partial [Dolichospermum sp.]